MTRAAPLAVGVAVAILSCLAATLPATAQTATNATLASVASTNLGQDQIADLRSALIDPAVASDLVVKRTTSTGAHLLEVTVNGDTFEAVSVADARLKSLSASIEERIKAESRDSPSALTALWDRFHTRSVPVIRGLGDATSITGGLFNFSVAAAAKDQTGVNESFALAIERANAKDIALSFSQLQLLPAPSLLNQASRRRTALRPMATAYGTTIDAVATALDDPSSTNKTTIALAGVATRQAFLDAWPQLAEDPDARHVAALTYDALSRQSELKATYGLLSNFTPASYGSIFVQAGRAVQVVGADGRQICSGLAVADDWVMTAGHCLAGRNHKNLSVRLLGAQGAPPPTSDIDAIWPRIAPGALGRDPIDYVFFHLAASSAFAARLQANATAAQAIQAPNQVCFQRKAAGYGDAVVVIGYDAAEGLVYDHAYVLFPWRVNAAQLNEVEAMMGLRLQRLAEAVKPGSPNEQIRFFKESLAGFRRAYGHKTGGGADQEFEYRSRSIDVSADRPVFGFDTDTRTGNSGGPVYFRNSPCVIGVFAGGRADNLQIDEGTWREHEFATPFEAIWQDLAAQRGAVAALADDDFGKAVRALYRRLEID